MLPTNTILNSSLESIIVKKNKKSYVDKNKSGRDRNKSCGGSMAEKIRKTFSHCNIQTICAYRKQSSNIKCSTILSTAHRFQTFHALP